MFGTPQTSTTSPFNSPSTSQTTFGFGTPANRMQSTFGQPAAFTANRTAPATGFGVGATTSTGLFGSQTSTTPFFGSPSTTQQTTPFGATSTAASPFGGGAATTSLFGGTNTAQTSTQSLFGQNTFSATTPFSGATATNTMQAPGTTIKFNPLIGSDTMLKNNINTTISTRHQCITAMKEYETKSMEELRWEDYQANRKGPQAQGAMFGQTATTESLFGATQQQQQQQQQQQSATTAPFSSGTNSIFGKPTFGTSTSLFNAPTFGTQQAKPAFGTAPTTTTFSFGPVNQQPATVTSGGSLFNPTPSSFTPSTNFFQPPATNTQTKSLFGTSTTTATPSLFGAQATTTTPSLFGANVSTTAAKPGFGLPTTGTNTFGTTAPFGQNTFMFNSNPATTTASLFSSNLSTTVSTANTNAMNKPANLFNFSSNPITTPTFNPTNPTMTNFNTGNVFNSGTNFFGTTGTTGSLFSNPLQPGQTQVPPMSLQQSLTQNMPTSELLLSRLQHMPYGDSPISQNLLNAAHSQPVKFSTDSKTLYQYKVSLRTTSAPKLPRNVHASQVNSSFLFDDLEDEKAQEEPKSALDLFAPRRNIKRLVLKPKDSSLNASITDSPTLSFAQRPISSASKENVAENTVSELFSINQNNATNASTTTTTITASNTNNNNNNNSNHGTPRNSVTFGETSIMGDNLNNSSLLGVGDSNDESSLICPSTPPPPLKCGLKLTKLDYYTKPAYKDLDKYYNSSNDTCPVPSFIIGREGYGEIYWEDPLDVKGLNLDEIVHIRRKEVIVYPDDDCKPEIGEGLNRPAQITLHQVWPVDKTTHEIIKDIDRLRTMKYTEKIEAATNKLGATFKEYRPESGSWVFCVKHFSKYGLVDDDDDDLPDDKEQLPPPPPPPSSVLPAGRLILHKPSQSTQTKEPPTFEIMEMRSDKSYADYTLIHDRSALNISQISQITGAGALVTDFKDLSVEKVPEIFSSYYDSMRFALFSEEDDGDQVAQTNFKRPKRTPNVADEKKPMVEMPTSYVTKIHFVKKRELILEPDIFPFSHNLFYDSCAVRHSLSPKIRFFNGSSNFTLIKGTNVIIYNLDLISEVSDHYSRFDTQLKDNSTISSQESEPPFIETKPKALNKHNVAHLEKFVEAFFGDLSETTLYGQQHERINRVIDWLAERNKLVKKPRDLSSRIIHNLCCNDLKGAIDEALVGRMPKISILLCSGNNLNVKSSTIKQLESWRKSGADAFIDKNLLKIYVILSGGVRWVTSSGDEIDVLDGLTWTQQLCLMLVFSTHDGLPDCIENLTVETNDIEYHLLARHSPFHAIDAADNYLEGWFLHQSLQSYKVIENDSRSDLIHMIVWSQLISKNVLLACFVACHIKDDFLRNYAVTEAITHYSPVFRAQDDSHLLSSLSIPKSLLSRLKAIYFKNIFDYEKYAFALLEGEEWSKAHDAFVDKIFPELVIYSDLATLRQIIDQLKPHREKIPNWFSNGANVYDIYSQALISQSDANLDDFNAHLLKCENDRQTLCQSEMARKMNYILVSLRGGLYQLNTPIPPDYALKELNFNCRQLLNVISQ